MRSGVGAFCPRSRRPDLLEVLLRCAAPPDLDEAAFFGVALRACAEHANTPAPAATSSVRARWVAFRTRMVICAGCSWLPIADCRPELSLTERACKSDHCPAVEEP